MSRPIVTFVDDPPLTATCGTEMAIALQVTPKAVGPCTVTLKLGIQSCHFIVPDDNGVDDDNAIPKDKKASEISLVMEAANVDDKLDFEFKATIKCDQSDEFFTLLSAKAENADGDNSFVKAIEMDITC